MHSDPAAGVQFQSSVRSVRSEFGIGYVKCSLSSAYSIPVRYHRSVSVVRWRERL